MRLILLWAPHAFIAQKHQLYNIASALSCVLHLFLVSLCPQSQIHACLRKAKQPQTLERQALHHSSRTIKCTQGHTCLHQAIQLPLQANSPPAAHCHPTKFQPLDLAVPDLTSRIFEFYHSSLYRFPDESFPPREQTHGYIHVYIAPSISLSKASSSWFITRSTQSCPFQKASRKGCSRHSLPSTNRHH